MLKNLSRILQLLKKNFQVVKVVDGMELICGKGFNLEKAKTAAKSALAINTVHPTGHGFAKMSLSPPTTAALPTAPAPDIVIATTATAAPATRMMSATADLNANAVSVRRITGP
jgi:hypothetical protein